MNFLNKLILYTFCLLGLLKGHMQPVCFARLCNCYYLGIRGHFSMTTCDSHVREVKEISARRWMKTKETSVNVTNDSEDSNVGDGLINCYGSPIGRMAGSHRNTVSLRQNFSRRFTSSIDFGITCIS